MKCVKRVVCDIETDGLNPSKVWVIVCVNADDESDVEIFVRPDLDKGRFLEYTRTVDWWIGHHFISFDYLKVLRKFFPEANIDPIKILDTLVISRLVKYSIPGGHGLEAWGDRLGFKKPKIEDWSQGPTDEVIARCIEDTKGNLKLFKYLERFIESDLWKEAIRLELDTAFICEDISHNGFGFDKTKAESMLKEITSRLDKLDNEISEAFPPETLEEVFIPKVNSSKYGYVKGEPFVRKTFVYFNPASPTQIVSKLNEAGWKPTNKTKGHIKIERELKMCRLKKDDPKRIELEDRLKEFRETGWQVEEENLATLPADAPSGARRLAERITLASRQRTLVEWLSAYNEETKSIHPTLLHIGSWTQRKAHQNPNSANIPAHADVKDHNNPTPVEQIKLQYNMPMRSLWVARPKRKLIGVDADGIQLRFLAHLMDDKAFTEALVSGKKEDRTDAHSLNALKLDIGYENRDRAKTFIYAWILGAGREKVSEILKCSLKEASVKTELFLEGYPGLKRLKEKEIPEILRQGYFFGIDGRAVSLPKEDSHAGLVLSGLLQNGESTLMKRATIIWRSQLKQEGVKFWQVNDVHDEWQTETEDDDEVANYVEKVQCDSIRLAGEYYKLRCPMLGTGGNQGYNWAETH